MKIDVIASLQHYQDHMLPIWLALPESWRGDIHDLRNPVRPPSPTRIGMVASWQDVQTLRPFHRMIYVEHGAGQGYAGDLKSAAQPGYSTSGGARHGGVELFLSPSDHVAARWKSAPAVAVGCPKLDEWHLNPRSPEPAVCFAWHWESQIAPEARSAIRHYAPLMREIVDRYHRQGFAVYGHAHPKWNGELEPLLADCGMDILHSDREVFERASVLMVDNSSLGIEFASLDRPVVWLNAPWYRRDIQHGGRFWAWTHGIPQVDDPEQLLDINLWDFVHNETDEAVEDRRRVVESVYKYTDGLCAQRAADAIVERFSGK